DPYRRAEAPLRLPCGGGGGRRGARSGHRHRTVRPRPRWPGRPQAPPGADPGAVAAGGLRQPSPHRVPRDRRRRLARATADLGGYAMTSLTLLAAVCGAVLTAGLVLAVWAFRAPPRPAGAPPSRLREAAA